MGKALFKLVESIVLNLSPLPMHHHGPERATVLQATIVGKNGYLESCNLTDMQGLKETVTSPVR